MTSFRLSYFGLIVFFSFIILLLISRVLFPFADEPDWIARAPLVLFGDHSLWSPYYIFSNFLNQLNIENSVCQPVAGALSFWAEISSSCTESLEEIIIRFSVTLFVILPILFIIIFRNFFILLMNLVNLRLSKEEWNYRIDSLALTIIFPGILYYLGVLAEEQFFLVVSLYIFLFWGFWLPISLLLMVLSTIDFGNTVVVLFFILSVMFFSKIRNYNRKLFFSFFLFFLFLAYFIGFRFLELFSQISFLGGSFSSKSDAIYQVLNDSDLVEKYPVILRPIITLMSFIFMTPSGVKVPVLYVAIFILIFTLTLKVFRGKNKLLDVYWFVPFFSTIFFVFLFPNYANAKYYVFVMPFLVYASLNYYSRNVVFVFFVASTLLVFFHLILYRF
ncbi:hypothetical protein EBI00_13895 [Marinomonas hwangdonensis]|uniref:Uncharacterized protein n=1 Tax=Marinomonas hwangdonensis TaxID=1053647 RepID=A0A3M8PY92_9GAMM|nr:hypothetical protein [Marinomonas hwangdonensis]RNF48805.1 hypothetical protein EBI00_13895 [Marinomonas hwangdonensis]